MILFLEDNELILDLYKRLSKYEHLYAASIQEALALFQLNAFRIDTVVADINISGSTSKVVTDYILKEKPDIFIVLCTAHFPEKAIIKKDTWQYNKLFTSKENLKNVVEIAISKKID